MLFVQEPRDWTFEPKCINKIIIHGIEVGWGGGGLLHQSIYPQNVSFYQFPKNPNIYFWFNVSINIFFKGNKNYMCRVDKIEEAFCLIHLSFNLWTLNISWISHINGYRTNVDIFVIYLANIDLIYWSFRSSSRNLEGIG